MIRPTRNRVLVKREIEKDTLPSGLILPEVAKKRLSEGEVVAVGSERVLKSGVQVPFSVKAGDRVVFSPYGGSDIKVNGEEYLLIKEEDILAVK